MMGINYADLIAPAAPEPVSEYFIPFGGFFAVAGNSNGFRTGSNNAAEQLCSGNLKSHKKIKEVVNG